MISIKNLSHSYSGGTRALSDLNLDIGTGLVGLLGANGAGKSTLMRVICTLLQPTQGEVTVDGHSVVSDRTAVRRLLGYLPQDFGAWRPQRVDVVLDTLARLSGMRNREARRDKVREVLGLVGLGDVGSRRVYKLSGGMLRRLGVAQALIHDPRVLIMDEPSVGLDPEERLRFRKLMAQLARERLVLLSTHIVSDLGTSCSDLIVIDKGRVKFRGAPDAFIAGARGRVTELSFAPDEDPSAALPPDYEVISSLTKDGRSVVRGVSRNGSPAGQARVVEDISIEEAYMAFAIDHGGAAKAAADGGSRPVSRGF